MMICLPQLRQLPLRLKHGYTAFSMNITIEGNFKRTTDNDPLVGFMDDTHQAWLVQRGDNGVWLTLGQVVRDKFNNTLISANHIDHRAQGSRADKFRIHLNQVNQGKGLTTVTVEHDISRHNTADKAVYKQKGWRTSGHAQPLHLVAFRDDHDEIYEFTEIRVDYTKEY